MTINTDKTKLMLIASRQKRNSLTESDLNITFNVSVGIAQWFRTGVSELHTYSVGCGFAFRLGRIYV